MTTDEVIEAFGGRNEVARITGAKPNAVTQWRLAGIPFRHWPALIREASARELSDITLDTLPDTRPPPRREHEAAA